MLDDICQTIDVTMPTDDEDETRVTLRMPTTLREELQQAADLDGRSLNNWCVRALQNAVGALPPGVSQRERRQQVSEQRRAARKRGRRGGE
jgi:hypothetical protein